MAYNTVTNYYNSNIADSYGANISAQIKRIEDAHKVIRSKAIEMGLKIPQGAKLTSNASGTTELLLKDSHHILDTAAAINNMPINTDQSQTIDAGSSYTVPVGYNASEYIITASNLSGQTSGTAAAADILAGKTAWVNGTKVTGTMSNLSGNQKATGIGSYTNNNDNYLQIAIPATGKYTKDSFLQSDIRYINHQDVEVPVTVITTETGETLFDSSKMVFQTGYYSTPFNVHAVYKPGDTNKVINISNTVGTTLSAKEGSLTIPTGYDYLAPNAAYKIKDGTISAVTYSANSATGVITFGGGEVETAGWVSSDVAKPSTYTPTKAVYTTDPVTGLATVTTAGWVTKDSTVGGLKPGSTTLSGPTIASSATTIGGTSIAANEYYVKLDTTAGYIGTNSKAINIGRAITKAITSSATSGGTTITTKRWKVTTSKGYNPSEVITELVVQDGTVNPSVTIDDSYICSIQITKSGWVDAKTVSLTINAADQACSLNEDILSKTNNSTPIEVTAASGSLMKSLTIDTSYLYSRLASI